MALDWEGGLLPDLGSNGPELAPVGGGYLCIRLRNVRPRLAEGGRDARHKPDYGE